MSGGRSRSQKHQNRVPFVAKRDIKRNEGDRERELGLRNLALQNICKRCQQKIVWRFQMGKYKAKKPGTRGRCNKCEQKSVRMAYRSLCDACGKAHDLCPGCQHPPSEANASRDVPEARRVVRLGIRRRIGTSVRRRGILVAARRARECNKHL